METIFTCHIDVHPFTCKPTNEDTKGIQTRLNANHEEGSKAETTIEKLAQAIEKGYTIRPCYSYCEDDTDHPKTDSNGNQRFDRFRKPLYKQKYTFISQQLILADIDNEGKDKKRLPDGEYMTLDRIGEILQENDLAGAIVYHSFSSKPEWEKFRVGILLDEPITDLEERNKCVLAVFKLFGMATDKKCKDVSRIFYGSKPDSVIYAKECTVKKQALLQLYDELFKPELDAQTTLDNNQNEDITTEKPLNNTFIPPTAPTSEGCAMEWDGEIQAPTSQKGNSSMHSGGIDTTLSPEYKPEDLLSMIDVNALDYGEWFSVSSAYKGMGGNREEWVQWNSGWNGENGKGTNRTADANSWNGANGTPSKGTLIYYAKLHSPQLYEDYKQAMNPHSRKFADTSLRIGNSSKRKEKIAMFWEWVRSTRESLKTSPNHKTPKIGLTESILKKYMQAYEFYVEYDEITRDFLYKGFDGSPIHLPETIPTHIEDDLQFDFGNAKVDRLNRLLTKIGTDNTVNPIRTMIENAQWDGKDRLSEWYQLFLIPETDKLSQLLIRKWAMQAICGLYNDPYNPFSLDIILVFQGKQGVGKTRFFEHLAMFPKYFKEGAVLDPTNKDSVIECTGKWITELGEIGSTMRKDVDRLKSFLSLSMDEFRKPYERNSLKYPRRTSFVGTVNDERFLLDQTGNRRFATIPLNLTAPIPFYKIQNFDALQFWAQILQIVRDAIANGETFSSCFRLSDSEKQALESRNLEYLKLLPYEQEFLDVMQKFEMKNPNHVEWKFTTPTNWISSNPELSGCSGERLGKILAKYGYEKKNARVNGKFMHGYVLPFKKIMQV